METKKQLKMLILAILLTGLAGFGMNQVIAVSTSSYSFAQVNTENSAEIDSLTREIEDRKQAIQEVENKRKDLEVQLNLVQRETYTIQTQISSLDNQIQDTEYEIQKRVIETEQRKLEIERLSKLIEEKEVEIGDTKVRLASLIRIIDQHDRENKLFVLLARDSFSAYLDDIRSAADLQVKIQSEVKELRTAKEDLDTQKTDQENKTKELEEAQEALERNRETLDQQKVYQQDLYQENKEREIPYQDLIGQIKQEEEYANSQVRSLENAVREKLFELNKGLISNENVPLAWPVIKAGLNSRTCLSEETCTATFKDPGYYSYFGRYHYGVDMAMPQGSRVYAPADGYITGLIPGYVGSGGLSILTIQHTDSEGLVTDMKTRYLHMSSFLVSYNPDKPQFVRQGEVVGYTGGKCGTSGAGTCGVHTTGSHLHFEVWIGSNVVNPLNYLP